MKITTEEAAKQLAKLITDSQIEMIKSILEKRAELVIFEILKKLEEKI